MLPESFCCRHGWMRRNFIDAHGLKGLEDGEEESQSQEG